MAASENEDLRLLTNEDLSDILQIVQLANGHLRLADMRAKVVRGLKRAFHAQGVVFFVGNRDFEGIDNSNLVSIGMNLNYLDQWLSRYCHQDPFQRDRRSTSPVCKVDDILSYRQWERLRLYTEFYRPQNIYYKLSMHLQSHGKVLGLIGMCRPKEEHDFSRSEVAKARVLAPHLATALENVRALSEREERPVDREGMLREQYQLTKREMDIVRCVCQGMTNDQIGGALYISRFTVETHIKNIFDKTGVKHRAALAALLQSL